MAFTSSGIGLRPGKGNPPLLGVRHGRMGIASKRLKKLWEEKKMPLKLKVFVCLAFQSKLQTCVAPRNKKWRKGKIILNGGFIVVSCILNRMSCHQFR